PDDGPWKVTRDPRGGVVVGGGVDHEDGHARIVLALQRVERGLEPSPPVPGDDDGGDRGDVGPGGRSALLVSRKPLRAGLFRHRYDRGRAYKVASALVRMVTSACNCLSIRLLWQAPTSPPARVPGAGIEPVRPPAGHDDPPVATKGEQHHG